MNVGDWQIAKLLSELNDAIRTLIQIAVDALNQIGQTEETKELGDDEQYNLVYSRLN